MLEMHCLAIIMSRVLVQGLGHAHRLDDAFELLEAIEAGTAPGKPVLSDVHLNTLVNACVEAGKAWCWHLLKSVYVSMCFMI